MTTPSDGLQLARAHQLLSAGHAGEAEQLARSVLGRDPDSAEAFSVLAEALIDRGRPGAAVTAARSGLALDPHDLDLRRLLVHALCRVRRSDEAREVATSMVEDAPSSWATHYTLGLAWLGQPYPRARMALASARRAQELAPASPDPLVLVGMSEGRLGHSRAERAAYRDALSLDPSHAYALNNLAATEINRGRLRRGGRTLTSALSSAPHSEIARRNFVVLVSRITVWFFLVALVGLLAVLALAFRPWYVHASVATADLTILLILVWQVLRVLPRGVRSWGPLVWRQADDHTRLRLVVGALLTLGVLGLGLAPSFHAPEVPGQQAGSTGRPQGADPGGAAHPPADQLALLHLAPLGLPIGILLVRLVISVTRTRPRQRDRDDSSGHPYGFG